jgi:hypothetical protein
MGFQPAFAVERRVSNENNTSVNELIEVTFRVCKFNKIIENTVWLTQEESDELDIIIDNFKKDLENVKDRNEKNKIYDNAIISFNKLGLLPNDINCEEVKNLVTNDIYHKFRNKLKMSSENNYKSDIFSNYFCSITGGSEHTTIFPHITSFLYRIGWSILEWLAQFDDDHFEILVLFFAFMFTFEAGDIFLENKDRGFFGSKISYGMGLDEPFNKFPLFPATGWIITIGLNGIKSFEGLYYGQFYNYTNFRGEDVVSDYIGATGFTGIQIDKDTYVFYMGVALRVQIGTEPRS